jgi:hypothetical protein
MASTYTANLGIEKPGSGEQSGTWGTTTNTNFDIIDRAISGVVALTLTGTTTTLTTSDGALSDGGHRVLVLSGSPSGTNTITISPNDQDKLYLVHNNTSQSAVFTQGSGSNATVPAGDFAWVFADGAGSGAAVTLVTVDTSQLADSSITSAKIADGTIATADIADDAVTAAKIENDTITATQIAADAVGSSELADNAVDTAAIANSAVTSAKIADGTIATADIADDAVTSAKIAATTIVAGNIANNTITATQIAADAVGASELANNAVDTAAIVDDAVTSAKIANNAVALATQTTGNFVATVAAGSGMSVTGSGSENAAVTVAHDDTSSQASSNNSGRTYIQDITLDTFGHVTGIATATETVVDTNTQYTAGSGLDLSGTTFSVEADLRDGITHVGRDSNDYIAIGTTTIGFFLDGAEDMRLSNNGNLDVEGDVTAFSTSVGSDIRLKTDIQPVSDALEKVNSLTGYTFTFKRNDKSSAGVLAQEVEQVLPSAVGLSSSFRDEKTYKTVEYDQLHALLIEAVKELSARVVELENGR